MGLPGTIPWVLLPWLLLFGGISARCLLVGALTILPLLLWWHRRALRLRRRTSFLMSWMLASLGTEAGFYALALRFGILVQSTLGTTAFATSLVATLSAFALVKLADPMSTGGIPDAAGATTRANRCAVCDLLVPRYDHYCAWVDEPIGAANHRPYLAFVTCMLTTCAVGGVQLISAACARGWSARVAWARNESSVLLSFGLYGTVVAGLVAALLAHQIKLILSDQTGYEARKGIGAAGHTKRRPVKSFLAQTAPLLRLSMPMAMRRASTAAGTRPAPQRAAPTQSQSESAREL